MARRRKRKIDWRGVEADYRAGILSLRNIAANRGGTEGAIRKRAKRDGWTRAELKAHIIERSRAVLCIPGPSTQSGTQSGTQREEGAEARDEGIVDDGARTQIAVVLQHRKRIRETMDVVRSLIDELRGQTFNAAAIEELIAVVFSSPTPADAANRTALRRALSLGNRAAVAVNLVNAMGKLIAMERQAFGLAGLEAEAPGDPVKRDQERAEAGREGGYTDEQRAVAILHIIEKASREKAPEPNAPGTETKQ